MEGQKQGASLKEFLSGLVWWVFCLGIPGWVLYHHTFQPALLVGMCEVWLGMILFFVHACMIGFLWASCALPYKTMAPVEGGPRARMLPLHPRLQQRMDANPSLDWLSWRAGILLRGGCYLVSCTALFALLAARMPDDAVRFGLMAMLISSVGALLGILLPSLLIWLVRAFWSRTEAPLPPDLGESEEGVGVAHVARPRFGPLAARAVRWAPLVLLLVVSTGLPLAIGLEPASATSAAGIGLAISCLVGYPLFSWSDYASRQLR